MAAEMAFTAILRELEVIGEAVKTILDHQPYHKYVKRKWRIIVDCRNLIAHRYFGISYHEIFLIIYRDIPIFENEFIAFLKNINCKELHQAFEDVKREIGNRSDTLEYLEEIIRLLR